jgi:hypothetical protein
MRRPDAPPPGPAAGPVTLFARSSPPHLGSRHRPPNGLGGARNLQRMPDRGRPLPGTLHRRAHVAEHVPTRLKRRRPLRRPRPRRIQVVPRVVPRRKRRWPLAGPPSGSIHRAEGIAAGSGTGALRRPGRRRGEVVAGHIVRERAGPDCRALDGRVRGRIRPASVRRPTPGRPRRRFGKALGRGAEPCLIRGCLGPAPRMGAELRLILRRLRRAPGGRAESRLTPRCLGPALGRRVEPCLTLGRPSGLWTPPDVAARRRRRGPTGIRR